MFEGERISGEIDVTPDVWGLAHQFVWANDEGRHIPWCKNACNQIRQGWYCKSYSDIADPPNSDVDGGKSCAQKQCGNNEPESGHDNLVIDVPNSGEESVLFEQQCVSTDVGFCRDRQEKESYGEGYTFKGRGGVGD